MKLGLVGLALCAVTACSQSFEPETTEDQAAAIYGGTDSTRQSVVGFVTASGASDATVYCSGTVIKQSGTQAWVVTAGHCGVTSGSAGDWILVRSTSDRYFQVASSVVHPDFKGVGSYDTKHDIQVAKVSVTDGSTLKTLALTGTDDDVSLSADITLVGWGVTDRLDIAGFWSREGRHKLDTNVRLYDSNTISWNNTTSAGTCYGDSGGAVIRNERLVGVISGERVTTAACGGLGYGVGLRMKSVRDWVLDQLN